MPDLSTLADRPRLPDMPEMHMPTVDEIAHSPGALLAGLGALGAGAVSSMSSMLPGRRAHDRWAGEDMWELGVQRGGIVAASDGVPLAVREAGPVDAPLTVVFVHGYCLTMDTWHFQRKAITARFGDSVRMVFYDQRGHGLSGATGADNATIEQLADDLYCVIESAVPSGPVVVVGHSMGGMTIMSFASRHRRTLAGRVVGIGLISTAASKLSEHGLGAILGRGTTSSVAGIAGRAPRVVHGSRRAMARVMTPFIYGGSFGNPARTPPTVARFVDRVIASTDVGTIAAFVDALSHHDETDALELMTDTRTTIVCGTRDLLTPLVHTEELAARLPEAELVVIPGAGHMSMLEAPSTVNAALSRLVADAQRLAAGNDPEDR